MRYCICAVQEQLFLATGGLEPQKHTGARTMMHRSDTSSLAPLISDPLLCDVSNPSRNAIQQLAVSALAQPASNRPQLMATAQATVLSASGNVADMKEDYLGAINNTIPQASHFIHALVDML